MKFQTPAVSVVTILAIVFGVATGRVASGAEFIAASSTIRETNSGVPNSARLMRSAYLALVKDSIVPAEPRVVGAAAMGALEMLAPGHARALPAEFGTDVESDASWLAAQCAEVSPLWPVFDAMARATGIAHTGFGTPARRKAMGALMAGEPLAAPGFNFYALPDGRFVVFDVTKGASANTAGLRLGDVLQSIDGVRPARIDSFLLSILPVGTEKTLVVERAGRSETIRLHLSSAEITPVESRLFDGNIGYVFVRWFAHSRNPAHDTAILARRAFTTLAAQGARGLIIDLRSTLGGTGDVAMASALCDGEVIYFTQKPLSAPAKLVRREGERCWPNRPIVLLVNEQTISAPESFSLAVRELAHAKIVGRKTAGALTEMSFVPLADGYSMTIPTGVVLGPVTRQDQPGHALQPDLEISNPTLEELLRGRDPQLDAARAALGDLRQKP